MRTQDNQFIERLKTGDSEAFRELVLTYEKKIYNLALRIVRNPQDAEDVLQEVFLNIFKNIEQFDEQSQLSTWIYRIATNASLMKIRKDKKKNAVEVVNFADTEEEKIHKKIGKWAVNPVEILLNNELQELMDEAIETLEPLYRTVFVLRDLEGLSAKETGEILSLSVPAVKSRLRRARIFLRDKINSYFENGDIKNEMQRSA